jgi:hypothetical protein
MHPVIIQAVAAQRNRESQARAAAARRAREIRRCGQARPLWPFTRRPYPSTGRGGALRPAEPAGRPGRMAETMEG